MIGSTGTRVAIFAAAAIALVAVWTTTGELDLTFTRAIVSASSVVIMGLLAFDRWAWRFWPFRLFVSKPVLHGTWKIEQTTSHQPLPGTTMEAYLVIDQTYSGIRQVRGLYAISNSHSLSAELVADRSQCVLSYIFRSEAHTMNRVGNEPSRGAAILRIGRRPYVHFEGDYWMERGTRGSIKSVGHSEKIYDTVEAAGFTDDFRAAPGGGMAPSSAGSVVNRDQG